MDKIELPVQVIKCLDMLSIAGFDGYLVGGSVRDYLLGIIPKDFDITTNALPRDIVELFAGYKVVETGIVHGTVMVIIDGMSIEVTTYRIESDYLDYRHPNTIEFTDSLELDLARRDFTMNAIAYHPSKGLKDPFGGVFDIRNRIIRAVGQADKRFEEDALRIMRAIRFVSSLGFQIEASALIALQQKAHLLLCVSAERIYDEFTKMLLGKYVSYINRDLYAILYVVFPEFTLVDNKDLSNSYLETVLIVTSKCDTVLTLRMSAFLHVIKDTNKIVNILDRIKCERRTKQNVLQLLAYLNVDLIENKSCIKHLLKQMGSQTAYYLIQLRCAITASDLNVDNETNQTLKRVMLLYHTVLQNNECYSLAQLEINGHDVLNAGISIKEVGKVLDKVLDLVIEDKLFNRKVDLLEWLMNDDDIIG